MNKQFPVSKNCTDHVAKQADNVTVYHATFIRQDTQRFYTTGFPTVIKLLYLKPDIIIQGLEN